MAANVCLCLICCFQKIMALEIDVFTRARITMSLCSVAGDLKKKYDQSNQTLLFFVSNEFFLSRRWRNKPRTQIHWASFRIKWNGQSAIFWSLTWHSTNYFMLPQFSWCFSASKLLIICLRSNIFNLFFRLFLAWESNLVWLWQVVILTLAPV